MASSTLPPAPCILNPATSTPDSPQEGVVGLLLALGVGVEGIYARRMVAGKQVDHEQKPPGHRRDPQPQELDDLRDLFDTRLLLNHSHYLMLTGHYYLPPLLHTTLLLLNHSP